MRSFVRGFLGELSKRASVRKSAATPEATSAARAIQRTVPIRGTSSLKKPVPPVK